MPGSKFDINGLLGSFLPTLKEYMGKAYGACNSCSEPAIPLRCCKCGEPTCLSHAWIKGETIVRQTMPLVLCSQCEQVIEIEGVDGEWAQPPGVADVEKERRDWAHSVLGLKDGVAKADVKRKYRELSKKYHPDHNPGDGAAEIAFKQVQAAWEALKDG